MTHVTGHVYGQECACGLQGLTFDACNAQRAAIVAEYNRRVQLILAPYSTELDRIIEVYRIRAQAIIDRELDTLGGRLTGPATQIAGSIENFENNASNRRSTGDVDIDPILQSFRAGTLYPQQALLNQGFDGIATSASRLVGITAPQSIAAQVGIGAALLIGAGVAVGATGIAFGTAAVLATLTLQYFAAGFAISVAASIATTGAFGTATFLGTATTAIGFGAVAIAPAALIFGPAVLIGLLFDVTSRTGPWVSETEVNNFRQETLNQINRMIGFVNTARDNIRAQQSALQTELTNAINAISLNDPNGVPYSTSISALEATRNTGLNGIYDRYCGECSSAEVRRCESLETAEIEVAPAYNATTQRCECNERARDVPLCTAQERRDCSLRSTATVTYVLSTNCQCIPGVGRCTQQQINRCVPSGSWQTATVDRLAPNCCRRTTIGCRPTEITACEARSDDSQLCTTSFVNGQCVCSCEPIESDCTDAQVSACTSAGQTINDDCECEGCTTAQRTACVEAGGTLNDDCECEEDEGVDCTRTACTAAEIAAIEAKSTSTLTYTAVWNQAACRCDESTSAVVRTECTQADEDDCNARNTPTAQWTYTPVFRNGRCVCSSNRKNCGDLEARCNARQAPRGYSWVFYGLGHETYECQCRREAAPPEDCANTCDDNERQLPAPDCRCLRITTATRPGEGCLTDWSLVPFSFEVINGQLVSRSVADERNRLIGTGELTRLSACDGQRPEGGLALPGLPNYGYLWSGVGRDGTTVSRCCPICTDARSPLWDDENKRCIPIPTPPTPEVPDCPDGTQLDTDGRTCVECAGCPEGTERRTGSCICDPIPERPVTPEMPTTPTVVPPSPCEVLRTYSDINDVVPVEITSPPPRDVGCETIPYRVSIG